MRLDFISVSPEFSNLRAIALTLFSVLSVLESLKFTSIDITQITIGKSRKTSTGTMMLSRNPVTVISATKV